MRKLNCFMVGLFLILPISLFAVTMQGQYILSPSVGYLRYASKRHLDSQALLGVGIGYGLTQAVHTEFYIGRLMTNRSRDNKRDVRGGIYLLDGYYQFRSDANLQPYLFGGVGAMHFNPSYDNDPDMEANLNAGGGLAYFFSQQIALRGDVRDIYTMSGGRQDILFNGSVVVLV